MISTHDCSGNPFLVSRLIVAQYFTEALPSIDKDWQWAMKQYGWSETDKARGNKGLASQDKIGSRMSTLAYLNFTNLRAFPLKQLRNLEVSLRSGTLCLSRESVQCVVKQLVHHIGEFEVSDNSVRFLWKV